LLALVDELFNRPYITFSHSKRVLNVTFRTAQLTVKKLVDAQILHELPGKKYGRIFVARDIVNILE
jgi:Fic family protein